MYEEFLYFVLKRTRFPEQVVVVGGGFDGALFIASSLDVEALFVFSAQIVGALFEVSSPGGVHTFATGGTEGKRGVEPLEDSSDSA